MHRFTQEQKGFVEQNVHGRGNAELTEMFNKHFNLDLRLNQIKAFKKNNNFNSGLNGRFAPGHIPPNKGKKALEDGSLLTSRRGIGHGIISLSAQSESTAMVT